MDGDSGELFRRSPSHSPVSTPARTESPISLAFVRDRSSTPDRLTRRLDEGEEAVTCRVKLAPPELFQLHTNGQVMTLEQLAPTLVAELGGPFGRTHDVREEDTREYDAIHSHRTSMHERPRFRQGRPGRIRPEGRQETRQRRSDGKGDQL